MVGVGGSSPLAPTKCGSEIKGLAGMPGPLSFAVPKKYQKAEYGVAGAQRQHRGFLERAHGGTLFQKPQKDCSEVNAVLDEHIGHVAQRIRELRALQFTTHDRRLDRKSVV